MYTYSTLDYEILIFDSNQTTNNIAVSFITFHDTI